MLNHFSDSSDEISKSPFWRLSEGNCNPMTSFSQREDTAIVSCLNTTMCKATYKLIILMQLEHHSEESEHMTILESEKYVDIPIVVF